MSASAPSPSFSARRGLAPALAALLLLAAGVGCGPPPTDTPDAGPPPIDDWSYFGLQVGRCYGFKGGVGGVQEMTMGVEEERDVLGFVTRQLVFRINGLVQRTDYLTVAAGELLIHRREERGMPGIDVELAPPALWLKRPVEPTDAAPLVTETSATHLDSSVEAWTFETTVAPLTSRIVPERQVPYDAFPIFSVVKTPGAADQQDIFYFSPEEGWSLLNLHGADLPEMELVKIWEPGGACGAIP